MKSRVTKRQTNRVQASIFTNCYLPATFGPLACGKVMAMDVGHLGQTLYLLSTSLGLGCFFTAAVNSADIEADLRLDGAQQGVMAMVALGVRHRQAALEFSPYTPRRH